MRKVTFKHIFYSLFFGIGLSAALSTPILHNLYRKALETTKEDVEKIYRELNTALIQRDIVGLQKLLADGFQLETSLGHIINKQAWIQRIQRGEMSYSQFSNSEVQVVGRNTAAVSSIMVIETQNHTDTWQSMFHLAIVRKGQNVQIQRLIAKRVCELGVNGLFDKNCRNGPNNQGEK